MEGMKLIDASEVTTGKKTSKIKIKKVSKSPINIIIEEGKKNTVEESSEDGVISKPFTLKPDIIKIPDTVVKPDIVKMVDTVSEPVIGRTVRAIKLKEDKYYGPKNSNKNRFVRMYKKLGLKWTEEVSLNGVMVDGWFNADKSQYIIKLLEDGDLKRFKFYGCDEIYDYFVNLGGFAFDYNKEDSSSSNYLNNKANIAVNIKENQVGADSQSVISAMGGTVSGVNKITGENIAKNKEDTVEQYRFVGADLWSGYRTRQLLKKVPDNLGVIWK